MPTLNLKVLELMKDKVSNWKQYLISIVVITLVTFALDLATSYIDKKIQQIEVATNKVAEQTIVESNNQYTEQVLDAIVKYPEINIEIDKILDEINDVYGFNRSAIIMYHDGTKTYAGSSFIKYSMKYERISEDKLNVKPEKENTQNLGYEYISYFALAVNKEGFFICDNLSKLEEISKVHSNAYELTGIKSFGYFVLTNSKDKPIGMLQVFDYDRQHTFTDEEVYSLTLKAQKISTYLSLLYEN